MQGCDIFTGLTGQEQGTPSCGNSPSHEVAGSEELVNLGLFADRRSAYRMFTTEGIWIYLAKFEMLFFLRFVGDAVVFLDFVV